MARQFSLCSLSTATLISLAAFAAVDCTKPPPRVYHANVGNVDGGSNTGSETDSFDDTTQPESGTDSKTDDNSNAEGAEAMVPAQKDHVSKPAEIKPLPEKPKPEEPMKMDVITGESKKLVECPNKLSVGRIYQWHATQEGVMIPSSGLIVVKENGQNVAKVEFVGEGWHVVPVWLKNAYEAEVDLSKSKTFTITYSATADLYVQLRPAFAWSGGDKWAARLPSTGGMTKTLSISFEDAAQWTAPLGPPPHTLNEARAKARGFVFIGNKPTKFAVTSLLIDGYEPPCP